MASCGQSGKSSVCSDAIAAWSTYLSVQQTRVLASEVTAANECVRLLPLAVRDQGAQQPLWWLIVQPERRLALRGELCLVQPLWERVSDREVGILGPDRGFPTER
jgi:hypothetical protein